MIQFRHAAGWIGAARGVIARGYHSQSNSGDEPETVETFSAHSVEWNFQRKIDPAYVVEWIANVPQGFIWTEPVRFEVTRTSTKSIGSGDAGIRMTGSSRSTGGSRALHIRASEFDLYVMNSIDGENDSRRSGQIVYRGSPDQTFRDKVRTCLSFVLGRPLVYLGYTAYCPEWIPTFMKSIDGFSIDGAVFKLHALPPFPINEGRYANIIDQDLVSVIVNALLMKFDEIKFNELSWAYWYAVCAPVHATAIHFGGVIEQLQKNAGNLISPTRGKLLDDETWRSLNGVISQWLKTAKLESDIKNILAGKISSLDRAPADLVLKRLLDAMGMQVGDTETKAWRQRNKAAHGGMSGNHVETILNGKLLKILFHRLLAGVTYCSDRYIDYYNMGFPIRSLSDFIPERIGK